jgi:hypothetical protein
MDLNVEQRLELNKIRQMSSISHIVGFIPLVFYLHAVDGISANAHVTAGDSFGFTGCPDLYPDRDMLSGIEPID